MTPVKKPNEEKKKKRNATKQEPTVIPPNHRPRKPILNPPLLQHSPHVLRHPRLHIPHLLYKPGPSQAVQIRLRMALIASFQIIRKINIANKLLLNQFIKRKRRMPLRLKQSIHDRQRNIIERLSTARPAIETTRTL